MGIVAHEALLVGRQAVENAAIGQITESRLDVARPEVLQAHLVLHEVLEHRLVDALLAKERDPFPEDAEDVEMVAPAMPHDRAGAHPVLVELLGQHHDLLGRQQHLPVIDVVVELQTVRKAEVVLVQEVHPEELRPGVVIVQNLELLLQPGLGLQAPAVEVVIPVIELALVLDHQVLEDDEIGPGAFDLLDQTRDGARTQQVVRIDMQQIASTDVCQGGVARRGQSTVGLIDDADARIAPCILGQDRGRLVGRAVVDADDLQIGEILRDDRVQTGPQIGGDVVDGQRNADGGRTHECHAPRKAVIQASRVARTRWIVKGFRDVRSRVPPRDRESDAVRSRVPA